MPLAASSAFLATLSTLLPAKRSRILLAECVQVLIVLVGDDAMEVASAIAPTLRSMDHSLSFSTTIRRRRVMICDVVERPRRKCRW